MLFVIILILITAVLLVLIVLAQNSKGGGLSSQFGGAGASNVIGVKKTSDLLEKMTWGFAIAIFALSMTTNILIDSSSNREDFISPNLDRAQGQQIMPGVDIGGGTQEVAPPTDLGAESEETTNTPQTEEN